MIRNIKDNRRAKESVRLQNRPNRPVEKFLVLVECRDEAEQTDLLGRLSAEGLTCRAMLS